jgi:hypothetical protein
VSTVVRFLLLGDIKDYDPAENIVTSNDAFVGEG